MATLAVGQVWATEHNNNRRHYRRIVLVAESLGKVFYTSGRLRSGCTLRKWMEWVERYNVTLLL